MDYKDFDVEVLAEMDSTTQAWLTSKPTITYSNEDELHETVSKMAEQDLPLSAFKHYQLKITSSILFRDFLFTVRPCIAWSSSFRINPIRPGNIYLERPQKHSGSIEYIKEQSLNKAYKETSKGTPLDINKLNLPLGTITQYVISIDSRTLRCFICTLYELSEFEFSDHIKKLCRVLGYDSYDELPKTSSKSLLKKLIVGTTETLNYKDLKSKELEISEYNQFSPYCAQLSVVCDASTGGQFLRQHFSHLRNQMFDLVKEYGYNTLMGSNCSRLFRYVSIGQVENFKQLVSRRICWVVHFDHEYETSGIISWSDILKPIIKDMTPQEFMKLLPCRCNWKNCSVSEETRLRLWNNKGVDNTVPDENPPCAILVGDPSMVVKRKEFYHSNSQIMSMWESLVTNGNLKVRDTKWKEEQQTFN